jgi:branched-chain amino acid aminotransferase
MLDPEGYVAEGSAENFFIVRKGAIYTPDLTSCLDGITRDTVFTLAADQGIAVHEKRISRDEVYISDEAFFSGTAAEIVPIRECDSRIIGTGERGSLTAELQSAYFDLVRGKNSKYLSWLTSVA